MPEEFTCKECGASFKTPDSLHQHAEAKHPRPAPKVNPVALTFKRHKGKLWILAALLVLGGLVYVFSQGSASSVGSPVSYPPRLSAQAMHIHTTLTISANGQNIALSKNIGIGRIHEPLHTHENDNVIHIESSDTRAYTLGNFFQVWKKRFDAQCVAEYCGTVKMTVDGQPNTEFGKHILLDGERIHLNVDG